MQSSSQAAIRAPRITPSLDRSQDMEPLASTKPATLFGAMCWTQAKLPFSVV